MSPFDIECEINLWKKVWKDNRISFGFRNDIDFWDNGLWFLIDVSNILISL